MSDTFSLSLPNVELIRVHMFYCLNMQIRHMQMTYRGKKLTVLTNYMYTRFSENFMSIYALLADQDSKMLHCQ